MDAVRGVVLKGRPDATDDEFAAAFARQLVTLTEDGIELQPLYDAGDAPPEAAAPGSAPYVRSTHAAPRPWEIRQRVWPSVDGSSGVVELESGATGLLVERLDDDADAARSALDRVLDGVYLDLAPISLAPAPAHLGSVAAAALLDLWEQRGVEPADRRGTLGVDPVATWLRTGGAVPLADGFAAAADLVGRASLVAPDVRPIVADGTVWHDAGATDGQELAWTIAAAVTTVRSLVDAGVAPETAFAGIEFRWAATADQFATITKLRAARRLWARVAELAGVDRGGRMFQHADGSRPMLTRYDPWVNALRSTVACFSAVFGGADAITVSPHDLLLRPGGSPLGRRIARNTQTVLQLESNLARVVDPAGGSWYVERRTDELANLAWKLVQDLEGRGGLEHAVLDGHVHDSLETVWADRDRAVATRRRPLTGLSEYPDIGERPPEPDAPIEVGDVVAGSGDRGRSQFAPLRLRRLSEGFEAQRGRADAFERQSGTRPTVYLATIGGPAASTARATFAKNLFEAGGIRTVLGEPDGFDPSVSKIVCLCSSDALYQEQGAAVAASLRQAGAGKVFVAGRRLDLDGVDEEIGVGSDVLDVLTRTLDDLGVPT